MAEKIYIYNSNHSTCVQNLYNELQVLIDWGWIKSIDIEIYNSDSKITLRDLNDAAIIHLGINDNSGTFTTYSAVEPSSGTYINNWCSAFEYVYICSHGIYISTVHSGSYATGDYGGYIITRTNNDTVGLISLCNLENGTSNKIVRIQNLCAFSPDDSPEQRSKMNLVSPYIRTFNSFMALPATNPPGVLSYFPYVYYMFTTQYGYVSNQATPPINFIQNGYRYLDIGWFALRDDFPDDE